MSAAHDTAALAAEAARLIVDDGLDYDAARHKAARSLAGRGRGAALPSSAEIEAAVREHIAIYCADTQPGELRELRRIAAGWMQRLAAWRPHLGGAVWRGTATRRASVRIDLYCDDPKSFPIEMLNLRVPHELTTLDEGGFEPTTVITTGTASRVLGETVTVHLFVRDADELRGALRPDASGKSWRGNLAALETLMAHDEGENA